MNAPGGSCTATNTTSSVPAIPAPREADPRRAFNRADPRRQELAGLFYSAFRLPRMPHWPSAYDVAGALLGWHDEAERRAVLDPDGRAWLRYDPARGTFARMPGTAEQAARTLLAEALVTSDRAYTAFRDDYRRWPAYGMGMLTDLARTRGILTGEWHAEDPADFPAPAAIASAMTDLAATGDRAEATRAQLRAGRSPRVMYLPMTREAETGGWATATGGLGYDLDDAPDAELDACEYREIPLRAAGYAPDLGTWPGYAPAPHPGWDEICQLVWPDEGQRETGLRSAAMGFTGTATKFVPYWIAETGQGKSLMAAFMSDLLGGYARSVPAKALFGYTADPQRAAEELAGTWLAIAEEGVGDQSFKADAAFKMVTTGGADLNARKLYQESRQVPATHTVLLAVNPEAGMNYADPAIMARLVPVRFSGNPAAIAAYAQDYNPSSAAWKAEAPAVLATMLGYARDFTAGKWKPRTLADLTAHGEQQALDEALAFAVEMKTGNNVAAFIDANRRQLANAAEGHAARDLYRRYEQWSALVGDEAVSETAFGRAVVKCDGVSRVKGRDSNRYHVTPPAIGA